MIHRLNHAWRYCLFASVFCMSCSQGEGGFTSAHVEISDDAGASDSSIDSAVTEPPRGSGEPADASVVETGISDAASDDAALDGGASDGALAPADAGDAETPVCPETPSLKAGDSLSIELEHGGEARSYSIHVGESVNVNRPTPIVVNYHGLNNSPGIQAQFSQMNGLADEKGFIVVYPQGVWASFNAGEKCCGASKLDDIGFGKTIVLEVAKKLCVDMRRVYVTGFSNGGYMSHSFACKEADFVAAIAPHSGALAIEASDCKPSRAVPVMAVHGAIDTIVLASSGKAALDNWVKLNGCAETPIRENEKVGNRGVCTTFGNCRGGVEVKWCSVTGHHHFWATAPAYPASAEIWGFLSKYHR